MSEELNKNLKLQNTLTLTLSSSLQQMSVTIKNNLTAFSDFFSTLSLLAGDITAIGEDLALAGSDMAKQVDAWNDGFQAITDTLNVAQAAFLKNMKILGSGKGKKATAGFFKNILKMGAKMAAINLVMGPSLAFWEGLLGPLSIITPFLGAIGSTLGTLLLPLMPPLIAALGWLLQAVIDIVDWVKGAFRDVASWISNAWDDVKDFFQGQDLGDLTAALLSDDINAIADEMERMGFNLEVVNELREQEALLLERVIAAREESLSFISGVNDLFGDPREIELRLLDL